jgi:hypothetical protein
MTPALITAIRVGADWRCSDQGWHAPDGTPEQQWVQEGLPLPENPSYPDFADAYWHHEAIDADQLPRLEETVSLVRSLHLDSLPNK